MAATSTAHCLDRDAFPDPHDIRLTGTSPLDAPIIKACRVFKSRKDREGRLLLDLLHSGQHFDVNAQDKMGYTPLMLACKAANEEMARLLLRVPGIDLDLQNRRGFTALMIATTRHWMGTFTLTNLVRDLLDRGADVSVQDEGGRTVWGVAVEKQNEEVLALLHERGHSFDSSGMDLPPDRFQHDTYGPRGWGATSPEPRPVWFAKQPVPEMLLPHLKIGLQPDDPNDHPDRKGREVHLAPFGFLDLVDPPKGEAPWHNASDPTGSWRASAEPRAPVESPVDGTTISTRGIC